MNKTKEYLISRGVRPSMQRLAILDYIASTKSHPTADQLYVELKKSMPTLSRMTVYNTLNLLADVGAIVTLDVDNRNRRFDANNSLHAHFICTKCGKVSDLVIESPDSIERNIPKDARIDYIKLFYLGICNNCLTK